MVVVGGKYVASIHRVHKKMDTFVFLQFLHQILVKFQNQGQFWKAENVQISKLSLILKFEQDLMEKLKKNERVHFFMDKVYSYTSVTLNL